MKLLRNIEDKEITLVDDNNLKLLEIKFFYDEFVWILYSNDSIIIDREVDQYFYDNLEYIMSNQYDFFINSNLSNKSDTKIQWLSDQYCNLDDENETNKINRLIIEKKNDKFEIYIKNPFFLEYGINRLSYLIAFSSSGNGYTTKNINTNTTFQDDMVSVYFNTLYKSKEFKKIKEKKLKKIKK